jgi:2-methylcitrate dehydratase PrpD
LAVTPNVALHATRRGELSMWKGVAAATPPVTACSQRCSPPRA